MIAISLPYLPLELSEAEERAFPIQGKGYTQVWKRKILVLPVLLLCQNDNELMTLAFRCGKMYLSRTLSLHQT